jgi:hypothetical protein
MWGFDLTQIESAYGPGDTPHHAPCSHNSINEAGKKCRIKDERYEMDKGMEE